MKRREFVGGTAVAAALPLVARAQQPERMRRIGVLLPTAENDAEGQRRVAAIRQGLEQLGWTTGGNLQIDYRWSGGDIALIRTYAAELVAFNPDVIIASASNPLAAVGSVTKTIPIVFVQALDPIGGGYVASLSRPGNNITGFSNIEYGVARKWLELLIQVAPNVKRVGVIHEPTSPQAPALLREIESGSTALDLQCLPLAVRDEAEIKRSLASFGGAPHGGLILLTSPLTVSRRETFIELSARHQLPCVYPIRYFVMAGGLASWGIDNHALYVSAMSYVDRILKGEKPGDLPIQQPTKFELVINLKTASALGLTIPPSLLARADEVIE